MSGKRAFGILGLLLLTTALPVSAGPKILLIARDNDKHLLTGFIFAYQGVQSTKTNHTGAAEIILPPEHPPGRRIEIYLVASPKREEEWFLVNPQINIPDPGGAAEVVLMKRDVLRQVAAAARDIPKTAIRPGGLNTENRQQAIIQEAARFGLTADQLETAIRSFAETQDSRDKGIAAFLKGQYAKAEALLMSADKQESDLVETLRYLGATKYALSKYREAADSFRKALAIGGEDAELLNSLGISFLELFDWAEAEPPLRRALAIDESRLGKENPDIAIRLNNLAVLLLSTSHFDEAETLIRRALDLDEKSLNPNITRDLNNLSQILLATKRIHEAEFPIRRAVALDERNFGPDHPNVSRDLNNLSEVLSLMNHHLEAASAMRRAFVILLKAHRRTGHQQPAEADVEGSYRCLLQILGKSQAEINATIDAMVRGGE